MWRWRRRADEDFRAEIDANIALEVERLVDEGMSREDAKAAALRAFGNVTATQERFYESRRVMWFDDLWRDVVYACRTVRNAPGFTLVVVLTLGLAIGVNNTVFTFVNALLLRGLPFDQPDRIVSLTTEDAHGRTLGVSRLDFYDWREEARSFSGLAMFQGLSMSASDEGRPAAQLFGTYATANMFSLVGERPLVGRDFQPGDDQPNADPVVILSNGVWTSLYGGDPGAIGRTIRVNRLVATVIGVMPRDFHFPNNSDLWMPWSTLGPGVRNAPREVRNFTVFGRLAPGVTLEQARTELETIGARLAQSFPASNKEFRPAIVPYDDASNSRWLMMAGPRIRLVFYSLIGAVALVLFIACANAANLLLVRASSRSREIAVRLSLGAGRWRVVRQLLVESLVLSMMSGVAGLGLSMMGVRIFDALLTTAVRKPAWMTFSMDARGFAFLTVVCVATALIFGMAPALHVSKTDVHEVLKEGGRSSTSGLRTRRWMSALVISELVLTLVLLAGAGFVLRSFLVLYGTGSGVDTSHLLLLTSYLPPMGYREAQARATLYRRLEERLRSVAAIEASALTTSAPLNAAGGFLRDLAVEGRPAPEPGRAPKVRMVGISVNYFDTIGTRLAGGRGLTEDDEAPGHVGAIVNQRFASMYFPNEDAVGRQITLTDSTPVPQQSAPAGATIVGIVPDIGLRVLDDSPSPIVYLPYQTDPQPGIFLVVRAHGDPARVTSLVREEMRATDPDLPLFESLTMDAFLARPRWQFRMFGSMFTVFAATALILSAVGLYAVTAYSVAQRTPEIGVRMALGAQPGQVLWLVLRRAFEQLAIALPIGIAGAFGVGQLLQSFLVRTSGRDPLTIASIAAIMVAISLAACIVPARRATRLDPVSALRDE